ncbi:MAG: enoyl-CoA hydratase [Deltaproteobacteria bacterium]|jgi:2-(1,2-epoxy-1,2-dihydrophenyl)acetyl-CoA isomerase|nr:enoyl-CoA hydratase [Deltaproteobacteria bacterium]
MSSYSTLRLERDGGVAKLTLARPDHANALDLEMGTELMRAAIALDEDASVRAVILTGEGKMFCAGGDLAAMKQAGDGASAYIKELAGNLHLAISRFARMRAPVISAVNGTAAGAGFSMMAATDLAIAVETAKFTMAYTGAGLSPDGSSSYFLPRIIGQRRTFELMLTNRVLNSQEALEWGLLNQVVPAEELQAAAEKLAGRLAAGATSSFGVVKKLLVNSANDSLESQMELEARGIADSARTRDGKEGIAAFLEKRRPEFSGH